MNITKTNYKKIFTNSIENYDNYSEISIWLNKFTSEATKSTYYSAIRKFLELYNVKSTEDLCRVSSAKVIKWRDLMLKNNKSFNTINTRISTLKSLFNHLRDKQLIDINPVHGVKRPKMNNSNVRTVTLTNKQVRIILDAPDLSKFKGIRDAAILYIYFYTGCKRSDVRTLTMKDIYEDDGYNVIDFSTLENKVPIHKDLEIILSLYFSKASHLNDYDSNIPLFVNIRKTLPLKPMDSSSFNRIFSYYIKKTGLPKRITPNSARTTFITKSLRNNCNINEVQSSVGHKNFSTTLKYIKNITEYKNSASLVVKY